MCFIDFHGMKPPFRRAEARGFTASSGEKCMWKPRPPQSGQAPAGALNEKSRGSMSGKLISQTGQTYFSVSSVVGHSLGDEQHETVRELERHFHQLR